MLSQKFLARLESEFPTYYEAVNNEAMHAAAKLREETGGDLQKALLRARFQGALKLWWPYVHGSVPFVGDDRDAMRHFTKLVLTVDHLVGYVPPSQEAAREQVVEVLRHSLDIERLAKLMQKDEAREKALEAGEAAAATGGIMATAMAIWAPIKSIRGVRRAIRYLPPPLKVGIGVVTVAALASIPLMAGYSAGRQAELAARNFGQLKDAEAGASATTRARA